MTPGRPSIKRMQAVPPGRDCQSHRRRAFLVLHGNGPREEGEA